MALWLQHQEAIHHKTAYHAWKKLKKSVPSTDTIHGSSGGGDGSEGDSNVGDHLGEGPGDNTVEAIPIYVEELLLQLTCWVECTT